MAELAEVLVALSNVLPLATQGAAKSHLDGDGIFSHHGMGTFWECTDERCVMAQARINAARVVLELEPKHG